VFSVSVIGDIRAERAKTLFYHEVTEAHEGMRVDSDKKKGADTAPPLGLHACSYVIQLVLLIFLFDTVLAARRICKLKILY